MGGNTQNNGVMDPFFEGHGESRITPAEIAVQVGLRPTTFREKQQIKEARDPARHLLSSCPRTKGPRKDTLPSILLSTCEGFSLKT